MDSCLNTEVPLLKRLENFRSDLQLFSNENKYIGENPFERIKKFTKLEMNEEREYRVRILKKIKSFGILLFET